MSSVPTSRRAAPTLEEVAAAAGVSRSTVSRVVNGSNQVSPDAAEAVQTAIDRLNYIPNRAARSLAIRRTMAIVLVVPEDTSRLFGDPHLAAKVQGIARGLEDSDYVLNLQVVEPQVPSEKSVRYLLGGNVDGALVVSHHSGDRFLERLGAHMPTVFGGRPLREVDENIYFVDVDNVAGAAMGTRHLIERGSRRIATIAGPPDMPAAIDRLTGWGDAMREAARETGLVARGDFTRDSGARAMRDLLARDPGIDGLFVANDLMAVGAISVLREHGKSIPGDIAIVGFDDSPAATSGEIQLTTVHQPSREMGGEMASTLLALLAGEPTEHVHVMPTRMVIRDSA